MRKFPKFRVPEGLVNRMDVILDCGGGALGDSICALPAINYLKEAAGNEIPFVVYVADYFKDFALHCLPGVVVRSMTELQKDRSSHPHLNISTVSFQPHHLKSLRRHLVHHAFTLLLDMDVTTINPKYLNYIKPNLDTIDLSRFKLPEKYVVFQDSFTAQNRSYNAPEINKVLKHLVEKGYVILTLGATNKTVMPGANESLSYKSPFLDKTLLCDLTNKTSLLESVKIISQAKCVFGVDGGLIHLAATTDVPIVVAYTNSSPEVRLPYRENKLGGGKTTYFKSPNCNGCQTEAWFNHTWDYRMCLYGDFLCVQDLSAELWLIALKSQLYDI